MNNLLTRALSLSIITIIVGKVLFPLGKLLSKSGKVMESRLTLTKIINPEQSTLLANPGSGDGKRTIVCVQPYNIIDTNDIVDIHEYLMKKKDLSLSAFHIIAAINEQKILAKHISLQIDNVILIIENVIRIKIGITKNASVSKNLKNVCAKKIIFGFLLHVVVKVGNI